MAFEVREIRQGELGEAIDLARSVGCEVEPGQVATWLSVLARRDQESGPAAVLLGLRSRSDGHRMELCVSPANENDEQLGPMLVDAALAKTRSQGISRSRLRIRTAAGDQPLWTGAFW